MPSLRRKRSNPDEDPADELPPSSPQFNTDFPPSSPPDYFDSSEERDEVHENDDIEDLDEMAEEVDGEDLIGDDMYRYVPYIFCFLFLSFIFIT